MCIFFISSDLSLVPLVFSATLSVNLSEQLGALAISINKTVEQRLPFEQA
jgi:hypothetical protein